MFRIREDFAVLSKKLGDSVPIYFDNACQTLRPRQVTEAVRQYYDDFPACAGRSVHKLATEVSLRCDEVRARAASFFGAESPNEIAFTKNTTEGLNTVVFGLGLKKGDEVVMTDYEHNSMHVPLLRAERLMGIRRRVVRSAPDGTLDLEAFEEVMSKKVKLVAMCLTSNVTGYTLPAKEVAAIAHENDAKVLFDAAQTAPSRRLNVSDLGADFLAASAHKMLGPSGVGFFYAREDAGRALEPLMYGGHGVTDTRYDSYELLPPPERFETGLQNYSGIVGAGAAIDYLDSIGLEEVSAHEVSLNRRMTRALRDVPGISIMDPQDPNLRGGIFSFNIGGLSPHDVAVILDNSRNIMMRSGMHCCHPYFHARKLQGCARASVYIYNTPEEVDVFVEAVEELADKFSNKR